MLISHLLFKVRAGLNASPKHYLYRKMALLAILPK
jgi:hypothetical protein